jgi:SAM-dependent methyltransferase
MPTRRFPSLRRAVDAQQVSWPQLRGLALALRTAAPQLDRRLDWYLGEVLVHLADADPDAIVGQVERAIVEWTAELAPDPPAPAPGNRLRVQPRLDGSGGRVDGDYDAVGLAILDDVTAPRRDQLDHPGGVGRRGGGRCRSRDPCPARLAPRRDPGGARPSRRSGEHDRQQRRGHCRRPDRRERVTLGRCPLGRRGVAATPVACCGAEEGGRVAEQHEWQRIVDEDPGHSTWYVERFRSMAAEGEDLAGEARLIDAMVPRGARILDAGCGPGRVGAHLAAAGHEVVGVDLDPVLITAAQEDHPGPRWLVGDLANLDLPAEGVPAGFDAIVAAGNVMPFVATSARQEVLRRLRRHLADDGRVAVGFGTDRGYEVDEFLAHVEAAGLRPDLLLSTWDLRPFVPGAGFLVAILRRSGDVGP